MNAAVHSLLHTSIYTGTLYSMGLTCLLQNECQRGHAFCCSQKQLSVEEYVSQQRVALQETREGYILESNDATDRRTAAEKRHDDMMAKRENERVAKAASKSHRERVNEFNAYLQNLSEHHDIPRVGPG